MKPIRWTVIRASGRAETHESYDYYQLLSHYHTDMSAGGSTYDHPNILLLNGKVVVEKDFIDKAWAYGQDWRKAYDEVNARVRAEHKPEWLE